MLNERLLPLILVLLVVILPEASISQSFVPGYIVKSQGDTVRGFLRTRDLNSLQQTIAFKERSEDRSVVDYYPADLEAFFLSPSGEYYFTKELLVDSKSVDLNNLDIDNPAPKLETRRIFLKLLVKGKANLYSFIEPSKEHYFVQLNNGTISELLVVKYFNSRTGQALSVETYKTQIRQLLSCEGLSSKVSFSESSFKKAVTAYNLCNGEVSAMPGSEKQGKTVLEIVGGITSMSYTYNEEIPDPSDAPLIAVKFNSSTGPNLGFRVLSASAKRTTFAGELLLQYHAFTANHSGQPPDGHYPSADLTAKMSYLFVNMNATLTMNFGKVFLRFGPSLNLSIQTENYVKYTAYYSNGAVDRAYEGKASNNSSPAGFGFIAGPGVRLGRAVVEFRYTMVSAGASNNIFRTSSIGLIAGFKLKKDL